MERDEDLTAPYAFRNKTWISFEDKISVGIKVYVQILHLETLCIYKISITTSLSIIYFFDFLDNLSNELFNIFIFYLESTFS